MNLFKKYPFHNCSYLFRNETEVQRAHENVNSIELRPIQLIKAHDSNKYLYGSVCYNDNGVSVALSCILAVFQTHHVLVPCFT